MKNASENQDADVLCLVLTLLYRSVHRSGPSGEGADGGSDLEAKIRVCIIA